MLINAGESRAPPAAKPLSDRRKSAPDGDSGVAKSADSVAPDLWPSGRPAAPTNSIFAPAERPADRRKDGRREGGASRV